MSQTKTLIAKLQAVFVAAALGLVGLAGSASAAADNPFSSLAGTWNGSGTARLQGGKSESLRCKGYYTNGSGGTTLGLSIRCANASTKVELRANLNYTNGAVTGDWEERTYNQSGTVTGKATSNRLNLAISGGIQGTLSVSVAGSSHQVAVTTGGSTLQGINISMTR